MHFVFTANSPGEVATWLTPTVKTLKKHVPEAEVTVFLVPCAFATGAETEVVRALPEVDHVYSPKQYWSIALGGRLPPALARLRKKGRTARAAGALLYLGGDLIHAARLARRLRLPSFAYVERGSRWTASFDRVLVPDEHALRRVLSRGEQHSRVDVIGNLMVDAVQPSLPTDAARQRLGLEGVKPVVAVFPGSRPYEVEHSLPFLLRGLERVVAADTQLQCVISLAPFVSPALLEGKLVPELDGTKLRVERAGADWRVTTAGGLTATAVQGLAYDVMRVADVALTLPGSNTAEMAACGLPMIAVVPLNLAEKIPLPGLAHYIEKIPFVGPRLKRSLVRRRAEHVDFVAWPNRRAGRRIVPEVRGVLRAADVERAVVSMLADEEARRDMAISLRTVMGPGGAAARIVEHMLAAVAGDGRGTLGEAGGAGSELNGDGVKQ